MIKKTILVEKSRTIVKSKDIDFLKSKLVTRIPDYKSSFLLIYLVFCFSLSVGLLLWLCTAFQQVKTKIMKWFDEQAAFKPYFAE
jgi:hypothetical protein